MGSREPNPIARSLAGVGLLWPEVSLAFPGQGKAVVQGVQWAMGPRLSAVVIQATDADGLMAGAESLAQLPEDRLSGGIASVRAALWRQFYIGGRPEEPEVRGLTAKGLESHPAPAPFRMAFPGQKPLPADQVKHPTLSEHAATVVPAAFDPKQFVICEYDGNVLIETETVAFLMPDLRFSQAVRVLATVPQAGKMKVTAEGVFRYSDRTPCWQAQWEDIINLRDKVVPKERRPVEFEVLVNGKAAGKLVAVKTEEKEVPLELASSSAGLKPKAVVEEVVTQAAGEIELPAGRAEITLIHHNMVDGKLQKVVVGQ